MNRRHSYSQADWLDDQRHQPVPEDEDTWRERMRERKLDDSIPTRLLVSSVRVDTTPVHDHVRVWNRGGLAGTLIVKKGDGEKIKALLLGEAPKGADVKQK